MRKDNSIYIFILLLILLPEGCRKDPVSMPTDEEILGDLVKPDVIDEYIYPLQPGTPEWANLTTYAQMIDTTQIPDSVLASISTWGLTESCFKYPLYGDYSAHNNQISYINDLEQTNKGFKELLSREDAPQILLYYYRHWDLSLYPSFLKRNFTELFFGSDDLISKLNERQLLYLISVALDKKQVQEDTWPGSIPPYSYFVMGNGMLKYRYRPFTEYCAAQEPGSQSGYYFWRINASYEKIEAYARSLLDL